MSSEPLIDRLRTDVLWHRRRGNETIARDIEEAVDALAHQVVVTRNEAGAIVAVTRQDEEGRILKVIAEATPPTAPQAEVVDPHAPAEVFLQLYGESSPEPVDYKAEEVTWCWHRINEHDVRYVQAASQGAEGRQPLSEEPAYTIHQIAEACMLAEVPDSKFESISIALSEATKGKTHE